MESSRVVLDLLLLDATCLAKPENGDDSSNEERSSRLLELYTLHPLRHLVGLEGHRKTGEKLVDDTSLGASLFYVMTPVTFDS